MATKVPTSERDEVATAAAEAASAEQRAVAGAGADPAVDGLVWDVDTWAALSEDEPGELVDGALAEEEVAGFAHELLVGFLIATFRAWLGPGAGFVGGSEVKLALGPRQGRKADVVVLLPGSPPPPSWGPLRQPPDLVIEVISPTPNDGRRDRIDKVGEYAQFGIPHYWLVDPGLRTVEILQLDRERRYAQVLGASAGRLTELPGCAGLVLDLDAMWAELDRLAPGA